MNWILNYFRPIRLLIITGLISLFLACSVLKKFSKEHYYEFLYFFERDFRNDSVVFKLKNPVQKPLNIQILQDSLNPDISSLFSRITLQPSGDTIVSILYPEFDTTSRTRYLVRYGDVNKKIVNHPVAYPFPGGKQYKVNQGNNGKYSHSGIYSRYAVDFGLKIGDTVTAVDEGFVVRLIQDYKHHGTGKKWREDDKSNYITIYHPHSGLYSQYVHLHYKGALVALGDFVKKGQPVAISGMTGFTDIPHLHFNMKIPSDNYGLISVPVLFENGVSSEELQKGQWVSY